MREHWFIDDREGHFGDITDGKRTICTVWPWPPYDENVKQCRECIMLDIVRAHNVQPAPVRDAAESGGEGDPIEVCIEFHGLVQHEEDRGAFRVRMQARDALTALRARVAGLEGSVSALGEMVTRYENVCADNARELQDARALLAVEREKALYEAEAVLLKRSTELLASADKARAAGRACVSEHRTQEAVEIDALVLKLRALAQPRAERETK